MAFKNYIGLNTNIGLFCVGMYTNRYKCSHKLMSCVILRVMCCYLMRWNRVVLMQTAKTRWSRQLKHIEGISVCARAPAWPYCPSVSVLWMCVWVSSSPDGMFSGSGHCHSAKSEPVSLLNAALSQWNRYKYAPKIHS